MTKIYELKSLRSGYGKLMKNTEQSFFYSFLNKKKKNNV